jgi:hypothetical protein
MHWVPICFFADEFTIVCVIASEKPLTSNQTAEGIIKENNKTRS